jgi:FAD/FMN-containing dehydrogenase
VKRRKILKASLSGALLTGDILGLGHAATQRAKPSGATGFRVRPGDPGWPAASEWDRLRRDIGGRLLKLESPFAGCTADNASCIAILEQFKNPYSVGDNPALTQTSGWQDAWLSRPSVYAVAARETADIVAAVNFARTHKLRLVVKGGGHSYLGTSNAANSLLVWPRNMNTITLHDAFVPQGGKQTQAQPAVSIGAGAMWIDAYTAVTTRAGRYVQGGGCTTVGVAGLVKSGGFGNFSKRYGTAASNLVEAEIVTADGAVHIANAYMNQDLFWAIKGGGGGTFGVLTRLSLRTHELPEFFGAVFGEITAASDDAYRALIARFLAFYRERLFNPHWGETVSLREGKRLKLSMVFQGLDLAKANAVWAPFFDWIRASGDYIFKEPTVMAIPARHFWDMKYWEKVAPGIMTRDDRDGAPVHHAVWSGDREQVGWYIHGYQSIWLPALLLEGQGQAQLVESLFGASKQWDVELHFNKGLAGAPAEALTAVRNTATNPGVVNAFALAIIAGGSGPAYPGMPGAKVDQERARKRAGTIRRAADLLREVVPDGGSYVSESDYFLDRWQDAYWGNNYPRLLKVKKRYDPDGLFTVHHGVGSER